MMSRNAGAASKSSAMPVFEVLEGFAPDEARQDAVFAASEDGALTVRGRRTDYAIRATNQRGEYELLGRGHCCVVSHVRRIDFEDGSVSVRS